MKGRRRDRRARRGGGSRKTRSSQEGEATPGASILPRIGGPLLRWYERERRDLPWRRSPNAYRIWVSEMMLQQTRVETVIPYYRRFLKRFPTLKDLARARCEEVLALWSGLGYYRRARALHEGARLVLERHGGRFPRHLDQALAIPGIGPYTAGAILSIAYRMPVPVVDGNVERVLTRLLRIGGNPKAPRVAATLRRIAAAAIPEARAADFNQAIMELGATVCKPLSPHCHRCPLRDLCGARRSRNPTAYPQAARPKESVSLELDALLARRSGQLLLQRRGPEQLLGGLWLFPMVDRSRNAGRRRESGQDGELRTTAAPCAALRKIVRDRFGPSVSAQCLGEVRHAITFRRLRVRAFLVEVPPEPWGQRARRSGADRTASLAWVDPDELGRTVAVPSLALKIVRLLRTAGRPARGRTGQTRARLHSAKEDQRDQEACDHRKVEHEEAIKLARSSGHGRSAAGRGPSADARPVRGNRLPSRRG